MSPILRLLFLIFFLWFSPVSSFAQIGSDKILPAVVNYNLIDKLFNEKLNALRESKGLSQLVSDPTLIRAAREHSAYMLQNDTLTHDEVSPERRKPVDRVRLAGGTHDGVAENVLFTYLLKPVQPKKGPAITITTYEEAAESIFQQWKNSPGHYKNMITASHEVQGIGFAWNDKEQKLYATQVFGMKPYNYPKSLVSLLTEYKINPRNPAVCSVLDKEKISGLRMANRLVVSNHKVYLSVQNGSAFTRAFKDPNDQIAIDIVFRDQFPCKKSNLLNGSPNYDGILLKPVPFSEIFKRNNGSNGRIYSYVCDLPEQVKGMHYQLNVLMIKSACLCSYEYPVNVESDEYDLINLQPYWDTIPVTLSTDTFHVTLRQKVRFNRGKATVSDHDMAETGRKLKNLGPYIKSIQLNAFSSVEGSETVNKSLQVQRANGILQKLRPYIPGNVKPVINASENWNLFFSQISGTKYAYLRLFDQPMIKSMLQQDTLRQRLEPLLEQERFVEFEVVIDGEYGNFSNADLLSLGILKSLRNKNYDLAHSIQSKIILQYLRGETSLENLSNYDFSNDSIMHPFFINLLAAKCMNPFGDEFLDRERLKILFRKYSSSPRAQFNFCVYAVNYWALTHDTIASPANLYQLVLKSAALAPPAAVNSLTLNYHLAAVRYFSDINNYQGMSDNLNAVHNLFSKVSFDRNTAFKLGLYFAGYNMTNWTIELLEPYIPASTDERFMHLYLAAGAVHYQRNYNTIYTDALAKYIRLFPSDFIRWIEIDYQLMRDELYKAPFCNLKN